MPKAIPNRVATQIRIDETLHAKTKIIAQLENRNFNSQLEYFVKKGVEQFEKDNGEIKIEQ